MSKSTFAVKVTLHLNEQAIQILDGQSRICNWLYNHLCEQATNLKQTFKETQDPAIAKTLYSKRGLRDLVPKLKQQHSFLKSVYCSPLKNAALQLTSAIQAHQKSKKGKRKGKVVGWPKFRSWKKDWFSLLYEEPSKGYKVEGNSLVLSLGVGKEGTRLQLALPFKEKPNLDGKQIRTLRITKELGIYSAVFTVQRELPELKSIHKTIVLDPNHKNLVYGVDSDQQALEIAAPFWLKKMDQRLDELKSKRDRCLRNSQAKPVLDHEGQSTGKTYFVASRRWQTYNKAYQKALYKRREQTKTFIYTVANYLFKHYDCVAIGDYTPQGEGLTTSMRRAMNNRSVIGRLKRALAWIAQKSGKRFLEYDETCTTRTCSCCHHVMHEGIHPSLRSWDCPSCHSHHLRDENSAINGLKKIEGLYPSIVSCSDLFCVSKRWALSILPRGVFKTPWGPNHTSGVA